MKVVYLVAVLLLPFLSYSQGTKALVIGDKMPEIVLGRILNHSKSKVEFSDFKGKAVIFDFWATWCSPCVATFPKMDSLQKEFSEQLQILPVTAEDSQTVSAFLRNMQKATNISGQKSIIEDTVLSKLFKHRFIPHYVWIDQNGIIKAMTGRDEVTKDNVRRFLMNSKDIELPVKKDNQFKVAGNKPFFSSGVITTSDVLLYHSVLTRYVQDVNTMSIIKKDYINCTNHSIRLLYQIAFGKFNLEFINKNRIILEGFNNEDDSLAIGIYSMESKQQWSKWKQSQHQFQYCYELAFGDTTVERELKFKMMQEDLNRYFSMKQIHGRMEKRRLKFFALIRTSDIDKIQSKTDIKNDIYTTYSLKITNHTMDVFVSKFQAYFVSNSNLPIQNHSNYKGNVDIEINCDLKNLNEVNKQLEKYDLKFVEKEEFIDMIVITKIPVLPPM